MHKSGLPIAPRVGASRLFSFRRRRCSAAAALPPPLSARPAGPRAQEGAGPAADDYGQHEALHAASVFALMVDNHLLAHPQVQANPVWQDHARRAVDALWDLYRDIAAVHIQDR
jgi:hypothetical protein